MKKEDEERIGWFVILLFVIIFVLFLMLKLGGIV